MPEPYNETLNSDRNWTEDKNLENGNYACKCYLCNKNFIGYKRRVVCKKCVNESPTRP